MEKLTALKRPSTASIAVATWNTEWATPKSKRADVLRKRLLETRPQIVCLTECHETVLDSWGGHVALSGPDWGYDAAEGWRQVLLWSKEPWSDVDRADRSELPAGRLVTAATATPLGRVTVTGMVIPYHFAHVRHGRRDSKPWQEHRRFLDGLAEVLKGIAGIRLVLGDFNQRIPSGWVPKDAQQKLISAFGELDLVTAEMVEFAGRRTIDHIACDYSLEATSIDVLSNVTEDGRQVSDHFGVACQLQIREVAEGLAHFCGGKRPLC